MSTERHQDGNGLIVKRESPEIRALLGGSILRRSSSVDLGWEHFSIERRTIQPNEKSELVINHHFLILWDAHIAEGESAYQRGNFSRYRKYPDTITTCLPGVRPAMRNLSPHEVIVGAIHPGLIRGIDEELDRRSNGSSRPLYGTDDPDLRNLLRLLLKESETGGQYGSLYAQSLVTALSLRLLYASRLEKEPASGRISPLPHRRLQRVLEYMQADPGANPDLATLAAESGYSRAHFLRSFRAAMGQTPHRYLFGIRLAKARDLIINTSMPLIEIAGICGFSSHSHLTKAFRSKFGVSPSTYRRDL